MTIPMPAVFCTLVLVAAASSVCAQIPATATLDNPYSGEPLTDGSEFVKSGPTDHRVRIINDADRPINRIQISQPRKDDWSDDIMPNVLLQPQHQVVLDIPTDPKECVVDIMAVLETPPELIYKHVDVCKTTELHVHFNPIKRRVM
jgi:hypothetical protein